MNTTDERETYMPTTQQIRVHRLELAINKMHGMKPSNLRDNLIYEVELMIKKIMQQTEKQGQGRSGGQH